MDPFQFKVAEDVLENILRRVADYPWHEMPDDGGWDYGTNLEYLKELCAYWVDSFNWRAQEIRINSFSNFKALIDGIDMHFILGYVTSLSIWGMLSESIGTILGYGRGNDQRCCRSVAAKRARAYRTIPERQTPKPNLVDA